MGKSGQSMFSLEKGEQAQNQTVNAHPLVERTMARVLGDADRLLDGVPRTPEYFRGDLVEGFTPEQRVGLEAQFQRGMSGSPTEDALGNYVQGQLSQDYTGGLENASNQFLDPLNSAQSSLADYAGGGLSLGEANAFTQGPGSQYDRALAQQAGGSVNPLTAAMFQEAAGNLGETFRESVMPGINAAFTQAGRTGSGAQATALTNAAGELADAQAGLAADMFGGAAESALGRQLSAAQTGLSDDFARRGLAADLYNAGQGRGVNAASTLQAGATSGLSGLGQLAGLQAGAGGLADVLSQMDYRNIGNMLGAGGMRQDLGQQRIDAERERYDYNANRPIEDFNRRMGALTQTTGLTAGLAGTGTTEAAGNNRSTQIGTKK